MRRMTPSKTLEGAVPWRMRWTIGRTLAAAVLAFPLLTVRQVRLRAKKLRQAPSAPVSPPRLGPAT